MKCDFCNGEATCHLTKIIGGKTIEAHVCGTCVPQINSPDLIDFNIWELISKLAAAKGLPDPAQLAAKPHASAPISAKSLMFSPPAARQETRHCAACNFSSDDFRKIGRLGCPECYNTFADVLAEVLSDCQKSDVHTGKIPHATNQTRRRQLEAQLGEAIAAERYEDAAVLRDQLRAMTAQ